MFLEVFGGEKLPYFKACVKPAKSSLLQCLRCSKEGNKDNETNRDKYKEKDKQIKDEDKQIKDKDKQLCQGIFTQHYRTEMLHKMLPLSGLHSTNI